jgi:hypothetical protein
MNENPKRTPQEEQVSEKFASQRILFNISHLGMLILVAAYVVVAIFVYKYYGSWAGALHVKGIVLSGGVILLVLLGVFERVARENFWKCPACGEQLKDGASNSQGDKKAFIKDCPKCGARLRS